MGTSSVVAAGAALLLVGGALLIGPPGASTSGLEPEPSAPSDEPSVAALLDAPASASSVIYDWPTGGPAPVLRDFVGPAEPWASGHRGVDLEHSTGPVRAAADGVVAFAGRVVDRGVVSIDHDDGIRTTYEPVAAVVVRGDRVRRGEIIGHLTGATHCAPEVCLHWGARRGASSYLDPMSLLRTETTIRLLPLGRA